MNSRYKARRARLRKLAATRRWQRRNQARIRETNRLWRSRNREKVRLAAAAWIAKHPALWLGYQRAWRARNPQRCFTYALKRLSESPGESLFPSFVALDSMRCVAQDNLTPLDILMLKEEALMKGT